MSNFIFSRNFRIASVLLAVIFLVDMTHFLFSSSPNHPTQSSSALKTNCKKQPLFPGSQKSVSIDCGSKKAGPAMLNIATKSDTESPAVDCNIYNVWSTLQIWQKPNFQGDTICFVGEGYVNLSDYCEQFANSRCVKTWDKQAGSYSTGCSDGFFYTQNDAQGTSQYFEPHKSGRFDQSVSYSGWPNLPDKSLSSFYLTSQCYSG